jgi:hypothetical protein
MYFVLLTFCSKKANKKASLNTIRSQSAEGTDSWSPCTHSNNSTGFYIPRQKTSGRSEVPAQTANTTTSLLPTRRIYLNSNSKHCQSWDKPQLKIRPDFHFVSVLEHSKNLSGISTQRNVRLKIHVGCV